MNGIIGHAVSVRIAIASLASSAATVMNFSPSNSLCAPTAGQHSRTFGNVNPTARGPVYRAESQRLCQLAEEARNSLRHMCVKDLTRTRV